MVLHRIGLSLGLEGDMVTGIIAWGSEAGGEKPSSCSRALCLQDNSTGGGWGADNSTALDTSTLSEKERLRNFYEKYNRYKVSGGLGSLASLCTRHRVIDTCLYATPSGFVCWCVCI
jgi:hypothetical protein